MKRKMLLLCTFLTLFILIGCEPDTINTVTPSVIKVIDNRFDGDWVAQDNSGCLQVKSLADGMIKIKGESNNKYFPSEYIIATVYNSIIDNNNYLNIQVHNKSNVKYGYLIAKYNLSEDNKTLKFAYINSRALKDLISSKNLKGKISDQFFYTKPVITDTSINIEHAILKYDNSLFKNYMIFTKGTCFLKK